LKIKAVNAKTKKISIIIAIVIIVATAAVFGALKFGLIKNFIHHPGGQNASVQSVAPVADVNQLPRTEVDKSEIFKNDRQDFQPGENPEFDITLPGADAQKPKQSGFLDKLLGTEKASANEPQQQRILKTQLFGPHGVSANDIGVDVQENGASAKIILSKSKRSFREGIYHLEVDMLSADGTQVLTTIQDFSWGVLAMNVSKSIYAPGETANLSIGVLNDVGGMVCDAKLTLNIKDPNGKTQVLSTEGGEITVDKDVCESHLLTNTPDYAAQYKVSGEGTYQMTLTANTDSGQYTISDKFEVKNGVAFDVERTAATRIYPPNTNPMAFSVTANQDFDGQVQEVVPASFEVFQGGENDQIAYENVVTNGDDQVITWNISVKKGDKITLGYQYKAPLLSPEFYLLGPLQFLKNNQTIFEEARQWEIASDTVRTSTTSGGVWATGSTWVGGTAPATTDDAVIATTGSNKVTLGAGTTAASVTINTGSILAGSGRLLVATNSFINNGTESGTAGVTLNGSGTILDGTGNITNTGTFTLTNNKTINSSANLIVAGTVALSASTTVTNNGIFTANGTITGANATTSVWTQGSSSNLTCKGGTTGCLSTGTLTANASGNTVNYAGAAQTIKASSSPYYNLTLSGSGAKTMTSVTTIAALTVSGSATMTGNAAFTVSGAFTYSSSGSTTLTSSTNISIGSYNQSNGTITDSGVTITVTGTGASTWTKSGGTFTATGTVNFTGTAPQIGVSNFKNLTSSVGVGNTATLTGAVTLSGNFNLASGVFNCSGQNQNIAGNIALSASTTFLKGGTMTLNGASQTITDSNVTPQDLGVVTIGPSTTTSVSTSSNVQMTNVTIGADDTLNISNETLYVSGNFSNSYTLTVTNDTVNFNGSGTQTLDSGGISVGHIFNNFTHSGAGTLRLINNGISVAGTFTNSAGTFDAGTNSQNQIFGGNFSNTATFTAGTTTTTFSGSAPQTLSGTMVSPSNFYNLTITNAYGTDASNNELGSFVPGIIFSASATATGAYTITTPSVRVQYTSGATYTFNNINWNGGAANTMIFFRNSAASGTWLLIVSGTQAVSYVNVSRSDASGGSTINASDGSNYNAGNDVHWSLSVLNVYYSVGQNAGNLMTGTPTMTIASGMATFSTAQIGNIGVGDRVTYNTSSIAYISAKNDTSMENWSLITATGGTPTDISDSTVVSIKHEYTTLEGAISGASDTNHVGNSGDLTAANVILNIPCYNDSGTADTTAVTVSGYTTSATDYIKIYTPKDTTAEANNSQRASGKWDDTKYNLWVDNPRSLIGIEEDYLTLDGLQIFMDGNWSNNSGISASESGNGLINISNCIIKDPASGGSDAAVWVGYGNYKVWNNLIYDFAAANDEALVSYSWTASDVHIFYNNTVVNCANGIILGARPATVIAKNNLIKGAAASASGTFAAGTDYNSTDNSSMGYTVTGAGNTHDKVSQAIKFQDEANKDFHLNFLDTSAIDAGTAASDANITFSTDIDGQTRPTLSAWDIGADEATTPIYRSVGVGATAALTTGTNNGVVISGSTATFAVPLADNIGVGDALQYDSDNNGTIDAIAFIEYRIDSTHYIVKKNDGTAPTAVSASAPDTDWSIFRAYTSLENAVTQTENTGIDSGLRDFDSANGTQSLVTNNLQWNIACYGGAADTTAVTISGWTTAQLNYLRIYTPTTTTEVGTSQRHQGIWDTSKYYLSFTDVDWVTINSNYVNLDGLQLAGSGYTGHDKPIIYIASQTTGANKINISDVFINRTIYNYVGEGIYINYNDNTAVPVVNVWNSVIIGSGNYNWITRNACVYNLGGILNIYNSTLETSAAYANGLSNEYGTVVAKNVYAKAFATAAFSNLGGTLTMTNCASADATGSGGLQNIAFTTANFINVTTGSEDLHLTSSSALKDVGTDLSADSYIKVTTDIDGQPRPSGSAFDIGADERLTNVYYSVGQNTGSLLAGTGVTVSIDASGNATLNVAQTNNIGVGDYIEYGTSPYSRAYISAKSNADQMHWTVQNATGDLLGVGTTMPVNSIKHTFSTLSAAIAGASGTNFLNDSGDLVASGVILNIPCYYDSAADTSGQVSITGYTTGANNYIRIYTPYNTSTEANNSQRHQGKWNDSEYKLYGSLDAELAYTKIDGLQIDIAPGDPVNWTNGISVGASDGVEIVNNIIRESNVNSGSQNNGLYAGTSGTKIRNNIIYNFSNVTGLEQGMYFGYHVVAYAYNNTVVNCATGFADNYSGTILKNNIVQNSVYGYGSGFDASSINNISNKADAPGSNAKNNTTVQFADAANGDFHLASTDTAAKNAGADLSMDVNLPITTDIDGQYRRNLLSSQGYTIGTDIGADESTTAIYRSIAPGATSALASGTNPANSLSISGNIATFATAPGTTIGVGDVIQYSSNNSTVNNIAFISGRTDATHYTIQNTIGGSPTATSTSDYQWSIFRAYTALNNAVTASESTGINSSFQNFDTWSSGKNISATNEQWNIAAYANGTTADTTATNVAANWITAPNNYIRVYTPTATTEVGVSQRHSGKWDDTKYKMEMNENTAITSLANYLRIEGLQFKVTSTTASALRAGILLYLIGSNDIKISSSIFQGNFSGSASNSFAVWGSSSNIVLSFWNNIAYNWSNGSNLMVALYGYYSKVYAYNNTFNNNYWNTDVITGTWYLKNNIAQNCVNGCYDASDASSDYNISSDNTAPGTHSKKTATVSFIDTANGDFHLSPSDTVAKNAGAVLSADPYLAFNTDIDGDTRPQETGKWDIGADEINSASAGTPGAVNINRNVNFGRNVNIK
jgi:hypothetical protein